MLSNRTSISLFLVGIVFLIVAALGLGVEWFGPRDNNLFVPIEASDIDRRTGLRYYKGVLFSGHLVEHYPSGEQKTITRYLEGRRHGQLQTWFENGVLAFESHYQHSRLHGAVNSWWQNGNKRTETFYVQGKTEGVSTKWYSTGAMFKLMRYAAGKEEGLQQAWRKNGKLYSNYEYVNGRVFGMKKANLCFGLEDEKIVSTY